MASNIDLRWVIERILLPVIFFGFVTWLTSINLKIQALETEIKQISITVASANVQREEMINRLNRIEGKLDRVIESK